MPLVCVFRSNSTEGLKFTHPLKVRDSCLNSVIGMNWATTTCLLGVKWWITVAVALHYRYN